MSDDEFICSAAAYYSPDLDFNFPKKITQTSAVPRSLFVQTHWASHPCQVSQNRLVLPGASGGGVTEVGIMESSLPASPWGTVQLYLRHKGKQKTRLLSSSCARRAIGVAQTPLLLRTKALCVGRGRWDCEAKKGFSLDRVHRLFLWQRALRTKVDAAKLSLFRSLKLHFWST